LSHNISFIKAREILDSRGNPALEVDVKTSDCFWGRAAVPSGASTGRYEVIELRDGDARYHGKGLLKAISMIEDRIAPQLFGMDVIDQRGIDRVLINLNSTPGEIIGGNSIMGVSLACAKAAANAKRLHFYEYIKKGATLLPIPFFNVINGGAHAGNNLKFQEFMIAPTKAKSFSEAIRMGSETYQTLKGQLKKRYGKAAINVGDEGGFAPPMNHPEEALDALIHAIDEVGYLGKMKLAIDSAASYFHRNNRYAIGGELVSQDELICLYERLVDSYPIISIEDPLDEDAFIGHKKITQRIDIQILGDDLFVTNPERLRKGIAMGAANALLLKVNQVGTLTDALDAVQIAKKHGFKIMASHRSGDTEDTFIADLAVGIECGQIKAGAPARGERIAKYNRLIRIEENLGKRACFPSKLF
jgi:enolase